MENNNPPFKIGQKVVALTTFVGHIIKGEIYTVGELGFCPKCKSWHNTIVELPGYGEGMECSTCNYVVIPSNKYMGCRSIRFAPIETRYADITAEIASSVKETKEQPDKVIIPLPQTAN